MNIVSDYLNPKLDRELLNISTLALAHIGDAVFELMVLTWLCTQGIATAKQLHGNAIEYVSARAQSAAFSKLLPNLSEQENDVFKRGRNSHLSSAPRSSSLEEQHVATGLEALFGYLYLNGETKRLDELFSLIVK